jgi:plasmid rolling circle replication initiator protein Rep
MYCKFHKVHLKLTKYIYITISNDDEQYKTTISAQLYVNNYYFNHFINCPREQEVFDYLINNNIATVCYLLDNKEIFTTTTKTVAYKMKVTPKALLNAL